jgi:hypothetical protein
MEALGLRMHCNTRRQMAKIMNAKTNLEIKTFEL